MSRCLVIADDFGLHPEINRAIVAACRAGRLDGASLIAHAPAVDWESVRALKREGAQIGVHVSWVGVPWSTDGRVFDDWGSLAAGFYSGRVTRRDVAAEAEAQVRRAVEGGVSPDHIDSHQHVHLMPGFWGVVRELAERHAIPRIRAPWVPSARWVRPSFGGWLLQGLSLARRRNPLCRLPCVGIRLSGRYTLEELGRELGSARGSDVEVVTHPGCDDGALAAALPTWGYRWTSEYNALMSPEWPAMLERCGFSQRREKGTQA